jgi:hypothetical protein
MSLSSCRYGLLRALFSRLKAKMIQNNHSEHRRAIRAVRKGYSGRAQGEFGCQEMLID